MERKYESSSTSETTTTTPAAEDLVAQALQKFRTGMDSSLPPLPPRHFYSEDKIREVETSERKKVLDEYYSLITTFRGNVLARMVADLEAGIEKITEEVRKANQHYREIVEHHVGEIMDFLCKEYRFLLEAQVSLNPEMGPGERKALCEDKKTRIIRFFYAQCNEWQWNAEVIQEQVSKLEEKLWRIQPVIEVGEVDVADPVTAASASGGSTSESVPEVGEFIVKVTGRILDTCDELKRCWNRDLKRLQEEHEFNRHPHWEKRGYDLDRYVELVEEGLKNGEGTQFSNPEYRETLRKLKGVVAMAIKTLSLTKGRARPTVAAAVTSRNSTGPGQSASLKERKEIAAENLNGADALMWERAFELDLRSCFPTEKATHQFKIDCQYYEFLLSKMIVRKSCEDITHKTSEWELQEFSSRQKLLEMVRGLELSFGVDYRSIHGPPKLLTEKLYGLWKPGNSEVESVEEVDNGLSSGRGQASLSQS